VLRVLESEPTKDLWRPRIRGERRPLGRTFASERFRELVERNGFTNIEFSDVELGFAGVK